jgi:PII-like signaling protein
MIPVKRLEIVIDAPFSGHVTGILDRHGLGGWTVLRGALGRGERGVRLGDEITGVSNNHVILSACPPERLDAVLASLRGVLARCGGICLVSDAGWLRH